MFKTSVDRNLVKAIEKYAYPVGSVMEQYEPIMAAARNKNYVLIGEASHGTKEFYRMRAEITQRLINEQNFDAVAVEADWPNAYDVHRYVTGVQRNIAANQALKAFKRFPVWMWRNYEILHFIRWLCAYNENADRAKAVGFYGLDLYSMNTSVHAVLAYLDRIDPKAAAEARARYACLDHFMENPSAYGYATAFGITASCEAEIIAQLLELRNKAYDYIKLDGVAAADEYFSAEQNAKLVKNAEGYYRAMFCGRPNSWNLRDQHMFETLEDLSVHLSNQLNRPAKIIVWAHNSHIGNAQATDMVKRGEFNIGQLVRNKYSAQSLLIGFSTSRGTVTAASDWDAPEECKVVRDPLPGSYEEIFHQINPRQFLLDLRENNEAIDALLEPRLQRAIGVVYRPETERLSHYFYSCLPEQFDFIIHLDKTSAVESLETSIRWQPGEIDETYPSGL